MERLLREESGFTLVELVIAMIVTVILMAGLSNVFVSGLRTSSTTNAMLASQTSVKVALERLELETRCAQSATLAAGGADVTLTFPSTYSCPANANGTITTITWCVTGGSLVRYADSSSCSGSAETFASDVTSATPFSCVMGGDHPLLEVALDVNAGTNAGTAASGTDSIAMRNADSTACS